MINELTKLIPKLNNLAKKASDAILDIYHASRQVKIQTKADNSPVTQADLAANEILAEGVVKLTPDIPVLSEEEIVSADERAKWTTYWCIDPLDGTREFIRHSGEFCINIALIHDHEPVLGLIFVPVQQTCYYACRGSGAFAKAPDSNPRSIHTRLWDRASTIIAASHGMKIEKTRDLLANLDDYEIIRSGSAIKFCWVAEGKADLYSRLGDTSEWDTAAGQCLIEEAGGCVVDLKGNALRYNVQPSLLNPHFLVVGDAKILNHLKLNTKTR